ncbi:hypothetical protein BH23BAC1_BH23BAC1_17720 [soil metagenome]
MPIEIKELIIRATVRDSPESTGETNSSSDDNASQEEQIVSRCVEQVMDILRIQNER